MLLGACVLSRSDEVALLQLQLTLVLDNQGLTDANFTVNMSQ